MALRHSGIVLALAGALIASASAAARTAPVTQANLFDRIQIQDMMTEYYTTLTEHVRHDIGEYFTDDAWLDANGFKLNGRAAIQHFYDSGTDTRIQPANTYNMLLGNPRIVITGDTAVMDAIWTGYLSDNKYTAPRLVEQGTEHTTFVKRNGVWMITSRTLVNKGGMPTVLGENAGN